MNLALWIAQGLLVAAFGFSGASKSTLPKDRLIAAGQTGVAPFPAPVIKVTAAAELAAVAGLILPQATGIAPRLTALAGSGLCLVMLGATASHGTLLRADLAAGRGRREGRNMLLNLVLLGLCLFVAVGRW